MKCQLKFTCLFDKVIDQNSSSEVALSYDGGWIWVAIPAEEKAQT